METEAHRIERDRMKAIFYHQLNAEIAMHYRNGIRFCMCVWVFVGTLSI